jgi:hypothetical protein
MGFKWEIYTNLIWYVMWVCLNMGYSGIPQLTCALYILTWKCVSCHNGVQFFISHLSRWLRTRRFSEPTFRPSCPTFFAHLMIFRWYSEDFQILFGLYSDDILRVYPDGLLMTFRGHFDDIQIISWWCSDLLLMIFGWFSDIILVMFRWYSDDVLMIFSWTLMTFIWYLDYIQMILSWYSDDIQMIFLW